MIDRFYQFVGRLVAYRWPDFLAILASLVVLGVGSYLAWTTSAVWLNRAGSLIIIIGVLVAASRFYEWIEQKNCGFVDNHLDEAFGDEYSYHAHGVGAGGD